MPSGGFDVATLAPTEGTRATFRLIGRFDNEYAQRDLPAGEVEWTCRVYVKVGDVAGEGRFAVVVEDATGGADAEAAQAALDRLTVGTVVGEALRLVSSAMGTERVNVRMRAGHPIPVTVPADKTMASATRTAGTRALSLIVRGNGANADVDARQARDARRVARLPLFPTETMGDRMNALEREMRALKTSNEELAGEVGTLKTSNEELAGEVGTLKTSNEELAGEVGTLKTSNEELAGEVGTLKTSNEELAGEVGTLKTSNEELGDSLVALSGLSLALAKRRLIELCVAEAQLLAWAWAPDAPRGACWRALYAVAARGTKSAMEAEGLRDARAVALAGTPEVRVAASPEKPLPWDDFARVADRHMPGWRGALESSGDLAHAAVLRLACLRAEQPRVAAGARSTAYADTYNGLSEAVVHGLPAAEIRAAFDAPLLRNRADLADHRLAARLAAKSASERSAELERRLAETASSPPSDGSFDAHVSF